MSESPVRAEVVYSGLVQGVGFRYTTVHVAASHPVTGYVMNQPDGTVELVAEGERSEVEAFLDVIAERMKRCLRSHRVTWGPATGEFERFDIRFA
jgi:acylphosphatase